MKLLNLLKSLLYTTFVLININGETTAYTHSLKLGLNSEVIVSWKSEVILGEKWIEMELFAPTNGYLGLGFSPTGGMDGSDIVIAWVDEAGVPHIKDFHGVGNGAPVEDTIQNYELLDATETDSGTTVRFRRKWDTCDEEHDRIISTDTTRLIWAYGSKDPQTSNNGLLKFDWHGGDARGAKHIYIEDSSTQLPFPDDPVHGNPSTKYWDLQMPNNQVDGDTTAYFCKIVKFPRLDRKHHMIGMRPIFGNNTQKYVHHILLYECHVPEEHGETEFIFEPHLSGPGGRCYTPSMPVEWGQYCASFFAPWTVGSEGEMFPEHIGTPIGGSGSPTYFVMEIHYNNPEKDTFTDSSAMRIFYTDQLRQYDSSTLNVGTRFSPFQMIPPQQQSFTNYGTCSPECTQESFPPEGIKVVSAILHGHLAAKKIRLRHFRKGVELPIISEDNYYDFNYQQSRFFKDEILVLPGDELVQECEYNTTDRSRITVGGLSAVEEMCISILLFYPRTALADCRSQVELDSFFRPLGIEEVTGNALKAMHLPYDPTTWDEEKQKFDPLDDAKTLGFGAGPDTTSFDRIVISSPKKMRNTTVGQYFSQVNWKDEKYSKNLEQAWLKGKHYAYCTAHGRLRIPIKNFVTYLPEQVQQQQQQVTLGSANCRRKISDSETSRTLMASTAMSSHNLKLYFGNILIVSILIGQLI